MRLSTLIAALLTLIVAIFPISGVGAAAVTVHGHNHSHSHSHPASHHDHDAHEHAAQDHGAAAEQHAVRGVHAASHDPGPAGEARDWCGSVCCSFSCHFYAAESAPGITVLPVMTAILHVKGDEQVGGGLQQRIDRPPRRV